jgi:hypothetical protein
MAVADRTPKKGVGIGPRRDDLTNCNNSFGVSSNRSLLTRACEQPSW